MLISDVASEEAVVIMGGFVILDFTGCMLQRTHSYPGRGRAVPSEHGVGCCCAGYQASLRHPVGLEDLGQGRGNNSKHPSLSHGTFVAGDTTQHLTEVEKVQQTTYISNTPIGINKILKIIL